MPGRREIKHFNRGVVDGEVFRLRQAEEHYERSYIRSEQPLFTLANSFWVHPVLRENKRLPIGYLLGVVWQENYMKTRQGRSFTDVDQRFDAYYNGQIKGFLAADFSVAARVKSNLISPIPERSEVLLEAPLYHYLGKEFAPIMKRLSEMLKRQPFKDIADRLE